MTAGTSPSGSTRPGTPRLRREGAGANPARRAAHGESHSAPEARARSSRALPPHPPRDRGRPPRDARPRRPRDRTRSRDQVLVGADASPAVVSQGRGVEPHGARPPRALASPASLISRPDPAAGAVPSRFRAAHRYNARPDSGAKNGVAGRWKSTMDEARTTGSPRALHNWKNVQRARRGAGRRNGCRDGRRGGGQARLPRDLRLPNEQARLRAGPAGARRSWGFKPDRHSRQCRRHRLQHLLRARAPPRTRSTLASGSRKIQKAKRPSVVVALMGCMAQREGRALLKRQPVVDLVDRHQKSSSTSPGSYEETAATRVRRLRRRPRPRVHRVRARPAVPLRTLTAAYVSIMRGCDLCVHLLIVPATRGPEESRALDEIVRECRTLADDGVKEVTLLGQTVNSWGKQLPGAPDLADLLAQLDEIPNLLRVRLITSHPNFFQNDFWKRVKDLPHVLPLRACSGAAWVRQDPEAHEATLQGRRLPPAWSRMPARQCPTWPSRATGSPAFRERPTTTTRPARRSSGRSGSRTRKSSSTPRDPGRPRRASRTTSPRP